MTKTELAWAAGVIDGEGCISIQKYTAKQFKRAVSDRFHLILKVTMCHEPTIRRLHTLFGIGCFSATAKPKKSARVSQAFTWFCTMRQVERVLKQLRPYLFTKLAEVEVAEEFLALPLSKRGGVKGSLRVPPELQAARISCYERLSALKTRSRFKGKKTGRKPRNVV